MERMGCLQVFIAVLLYGLLLLSCLTTVQAGIADKRCTSDADCPDDVTTGVFGATVKYACGKIPKQFYMEKVTVDPNTKKSVTKIVEDPARNYTVCECLTIEGNGEAARNASIMYFEDQDTGMDDTMKECGIGRHIECFQKEFTPKLSRGCASLDCSEDKTPHICQEKSGTFVPHSGSSNYPQQVAWLLGPILILKFWFGSLII